jgi:hypothetical protein
MWWDRDILAHNLAKGTLKERIDSIIDPKILTCAFRACNDKNVKWRKLRSPAPKQKYTKATKCGGVLEISLARGGGTKIENGKMWIE